MPSPDIFSAGGVKKREEDRRSNVRDKNVGNYCLLNIRLRYLEKDLDVAHL